MHYFKQLNEFYSTLDYKPLSANAIAIYMILLHIANKTGWIDEFKVANSILMSKCSLSISSLQRARNELIVQDYISYKKGLNQNDAPKYKIKNLYFEQAHEQADEQAGEQADEQPGEHINKHNKTKHKNKKENIEKKFIPPSLEDVKSYVLEKKLNVDAEYFYNYFTDGNWIDSKGNPVRNWKQKLITWDKYSHKDSPIETKKENNEPNEQDKFVEVDTSQLTEEEYGKLMRKEITLEELIKKGRINVG